MFNINKYNNFIHTCGFIFCFKTFVLSCLYLYNYGITQKELSFYILIIIIEIYTTATAQFD